MSSKAFIDIQFGGDGFSPKKLMELTDLKLDVLAETGEVATKGRYKGKKSPYGLALLPLEDGDNVLEDWTKKLLGWSHQLKQAHVDEIVFDIESSNENFTHLSIDTTLAEKLTQLNARIVFNKIEDNSLETVLEHVKNHFANDTKGKKSLTQLETLLQTKKNSDFTSIIYGLAIVLLESDGLKYKKDREALVNYFKEYSQQKKIKRAIIGSVQSKK